MKIVIMIPLHSRQSGQNALMTKASTPTKYPLNKIPQRLNRESAV